MLLGVLGPVEVLAKGRGVDVGRPRQQAILAVLAIEAGRVVPTQSLITRVWGEDAPASARSGLYSYLSRLRQVLAGAGPHDHARLVSRAGGYLLDIDPDRVDVCRFRRLARAARAADDESCADLLDEAIGLWRGPALAGLSGEWVEQARQVLEQERVDAVLLWAAAQLRLDRYGLVATSLRGMVDQHPLVEPLVARLIEALGRSGRTAEALECYAAMRRRLIRELGTEPGAELRGLHQALLAGTLAAAVCDRVC